MKNLKFLAGLLAILAIGGLLFIASPALVAKAEMTHDTPQPSKVIVEIPDQAGEGLYLRNTTGELIYAAIMYYHPEADDWVSEGWFILNPGEAKQVIDIGLWNTYYYIYGESVNYVWGETNYGWVHNDSFTLYQSNPMPEGSYQVGFAEFYVGDKKTAEWSFY